MMRKERNQETFNWAAGLGDLAYLHNHQEKAVLGIGFLFVLAR